ncbi:crossover junction endodeoxyribonuclease RuvC [Patescibacteria group bacterium]|nr:crossover junction endodeoxyribonuclease RuvC [Patescibacteria group bacterium]MBU1029139.1 crossover junction endodeoxyribonuclease RuvC [Patescibacteria group bacterium]MBU1916131.1 crossover junction endodeoxyribonuclease RuvC [Patescibacteria group bacterium]
MVQSSIKQVFLGVDPGYADMGFGIVGSMRGAVGRLGGQQCLAYGSIQTAKNLAVGVRLEQIYAGLADVIKRYKPGYAAVEKLYFAKNTKTALLVAEARGVILLCLQQFGIPYIEFDPVQVKLAVCGHGCATKSEMQKMVKILLTLKETPRPDDAADALALAIALSASRILHTERTPI